MDSTKGLLLGSVLRLRLVASGQGRIGSEKHIISSFITGYDVLLSVDGRTHFQKKSEQTSYRLLRLGAGEGNRTPVFSLGS